MKNEPNESSIELMTCSLVPSPGEKRQNISTQQRSALATIDISIPMPTIPMIKPNEFPKEQSYSLFSDNEVMQRLLLRICRMIIGLHYSV